MPYQVPPVSKLCGFPLRVTRVRPRAYRPDAEPDSDEKSEFDRDNNWVMLMMIEASSGEAPPEWQDDEGPVVVWRPDGAVSCQDMHLFNDFLADVKDLYEGHVPTILRFNPNSRGYFVPVGTLSNRL